MSQSVKAEDRHVLAAHIGARSAWFLFLWMASAILFRVPLNGLVSLALKDERYSHVILVPAISVGLILLKRRSIFTGSRSYPVLGIPFFSLGLVLWFITTFSPSFIGEHDLRLSVSIFGLILVWAGAFVWCYGPSAFRRSLFPLGFLILAVPLPGSVLERAVGALQKGSAEMAYGLFKLTGMAVFREGFRFSLPGMDIEIAEECSGIRSSWSLLISAVLAGHLFLHAGWTRICFVVLTVPIVIFKNAVRIVTVSWLGVYVDRGFFYGGLHRHGGLPFSLVALAIMFFVLLLLRKSEGRLGMVGIHESRGTLRDA